MAYYLLHLILTSPFRAAAGGVCIYVTWHGRVNVLDFDFIRFLIKAAMRHRL